MGCGPDVEEVGWQARGVDAAEVAGAMTEGEQDENVQAAAAFGWVSQKCLHWLSRREALHFHSAQVVGIVSEYNPAYQTPCFSDASLMHL